ncbi:hypothetical protein [Nocardioides pakistanensis]
MTTQADNDVRTGHVPGTAQAVRAAIDEFAATLTQEFEQQADLHQRLSRIATASADRGMAVGYHEAAATVRRLARTRP